MSTDPQIGIIIETNPPTFEKFTFWIGTYERGKPFVPIPQLKEKKVQEKIKELNGLRNDFGHIYTRINREKKLIVMKDYNPLRLSLPLNKRGIATLLELQVEKILLKHYPDFYIISDHNPTNARIDQLRKRGRELGVPIPLRRAYELTRKKVTRDFRKYHFRSPLNIWRKTQFMVRSRIKRLKHKWSRKSV